MYKTVNVNWQHIHTQVIATNAAKLQRTKQWIRNKNITTENNFTNKQKRESIYSTFMRIVLPKSQLPQDVATDSNCRSWQGALGVSTNTYPPLQPASISFICSSIHSF